VAADAYTNAFPDPAAGAESRAALDAGLVHRRLVQRFETQPQLLTLVCPHRHVSDLTAQGMSYDARRGGVRTPDGGVTRVVARELASVVPIRLASDAGTHARTRADQHPRRRRGRRRHRRS